jgi:alpha-tubulin suppressor-like RCC1 family protein
VKQVISGYNCFAALRHDGRVITWGNSWFGGDSSNVQHELQNVKEVICGFGCFAALRDDGRVITWGNPRSGGDSSTVENELFDIISVRKKEKTIRFGFIATRADGQIIQWP